MLLNAFLPNGTLSLNFKSVSILFMGLIGLILLSIWGGYQFAYWQLTQNQDSLIGEWQQYLHKDRKWLKELEEETTQHLNVLTHHLGRMEANLLRLNALGERVVAQAHLDPNEFNFNPNSPAIAHQPADKPSMVSSIKSLDAELEKRFIQINALHEALHQHMGQRQLTLSGYGKPVVNGRISSFFGHRTDPFTGRRAWHAGVDIAAKEGTEIKALAGGVVSFSAEKGGYGRMVEIHHGNGMATRYGHNKELLVRPGQLVKKGQTIATLGSTGRSTSPHVHLEVHKNGVAVDPGHYFTDLRRHG